MFPGNSLGLGFAGSTNFLIGARRQSLGPGVPSRRAYGLEEAVIEK